MAEDDDKPPGAIENPPARAATEEEPKYSDGRFSIEHQIDVHVRDLVESPDQLPAVLEGLRYLVEYRLSGRRYCHMDVELMRRLALALLEITGKRSGTLFSRRRLSTEEADVALSLFRDFLAEVDEFSAAVGTMSSAEIRRKLQLHCRLYPEAGPASNSLARDVLSLLARQPQFDDWRDLVKTERIDEIADALMLPSLNTLPASELLHTSYDKERLLNPPQSLYFDRTVERVLDMFRTNLDTGLTKAAFQEKLEYYGPNKVPKAPVKPWWKMLAEQFNDTMIWLLMAAIVLSPVIDPSDLVSPIVLGIVVLLNVSIGFVQEARATAALSSLLTLTVPKARVRRTGEEIEVSAETLVPGDIVVLSEGDSVPADLRLIKAFRLELVESLLTGESQPVAKQTSVIRIRSRRIPLQKCSNLAFMGTVVARGSGCGIVVRTGTKSEMGVISAALYSEAQNSSRSPLQAELRRLGLWLVVVAVALCVIIVVAGLVLLSSPLKEMLHYGLNLAVSVIPEGLVAVVTVAMALAVGRMAKRAAIVRRLPAVETLGSVSVICTDKTGTLTEGRMQVQAIHGDLRACYSVCALCNNASIIKNNSMTDGASTAVSGADTTETALLQAALVNGFDKNDMLQKVRKMIEIPFDSERKMMSTIVFPLNADSEDGGKVTIYSKGAPEVVLQRCSTILLPSEDGADKEVVRDLDERRLAELSDVQAEWSSKGWRVLGLARTDISIPTEQIMAIFTTGSEQSQPAEDVFEKAAELLERQMCFVGLVALIDPPRPGIAGCMADCRRAGIDVVMITGDHPATATAIAKQIGIIAAGSSQDSLVLKGREVDILGEEGLRSLQQFPRVFARVSPQNKLAIVKALQTRGHITAMTGDGVNDAPAIRRADIGIAMGLAGTDIAKQAADIVLADDNFSTIIGAIEEGRRVYDNITKFVVYILACNSAEIWIVLIALLLRLPSPLASIHILWANIIADIPPSMSIGCEPREADLLSRPPRRSTDQLLSKWNVAFIILEGLLISVLSLSRYVYGLKHSAASVSPDLKTLRAESFMCLTVLQLALACFSRSMTQSFFSLSPFSNPWMIISLSISMMTLLLGCYIPGLNTLLEMTPVDHFGWLRIAACCVILLLFTEMLKMARRRQSN